MRIYLIGPVGVGKSYILEELSKLGYNVYSDPIIDKDILKTGNPYEIQKAIDNAFLEREINTFDGIFDSSLLVDKCFTQISYEMGELNEEQYRSLLETEDKYLEQLNNGENHYIFVKRDFDEIKKQIIKRGRPYEINNPFYEKLNNFLLNNFKESRDNLDVIPLVGNDISPVINRINELTSMKHI